MKIAIDKVLENSSSCGGQRRSGNLGCVSSCGGHVDEFQSFPSAEMRNYMTMVMMRSES
jgi:hypothetical protein